MFRRHKLSSPRTEDPTPIHCVSSGGDIITRGNMVGVLEGHNDISADTLSRACQLLRDHIKQHSTPSLQDPSTRVLVANSYHMMHLTSASDKHIDGQYGQTEKTIALRKLLRFGLAGSSVPMNKDRDYYLSRIRRKFGKIVGLFNICKEKFKHFIVFEIGLPRHVGGPFVKVWDGMETWANDMPEDRPEIQAILNLFFTKEERAGVPVFLSRAPEDPSQEHGRGCGAFAFIVMCHLAKGLVPKGWSVLDDALARNYLWWCLMRSKILPLPQRRLLIEQGGR